MIKNISSEMSEQEKEVLVYALAKLVDYFRINYYDLDEEREFVEWSQIQQNDE